MRTFELDDDQEARAKRWTKKHGETAHPNGVRDMTGAAFKFSFIPTGMGCNAKVECIWCPGKNADLTKDSEYGEFCITNDSEGNPL